MLCFKFVNHTAFFQIFVYIYVSIKKLANEDFRYRAQLRRTYKRVGQ